MSRTRCPYCHDALRTRARWVACVECLARHHRACWAEGGGCATCRARAGAAPMLAAAPRAPSRARWAWAGLLAAGLIAGAAGARAVRHDDEAELQQLEAETQALEREAAHAQELALTWRVAREEARTELLRAQVALLAERLEVEREHARRLERLVQGETVRGRNPDAVVMPLVWLTAGRR